MNSRSGPIASLREEAILACETLASKIGSPLYVGMGGGLASEVVAEAFRAAQIPFRAAILRFSDDLNIHDISRAVIYCETRGLAYSFFEIDAIDFFKKKYLKFGQIAGVFSASPATSELLRQVKAAGGYAILGGGLPRVVGRNGEYSIRIDERCFGLARWARAKKIDCETQFFSSNTNLFAAYVGEVFRAIEILPRWAIHRDQTSIDLVIRNQVFLEHFSLRSRKSYTGYEKISERHRSLSKILVTTEVGRGRSRQLSLSKVED